MKKLAAILLFACLAIACLPAVALAAPGTPATDIHYFDYHLRSDNTGPWTRNEPYREMGTIQFDPATHTLTLDNVYERKTYCGPDNNYYGIYSEGDLTIVLKGDNYLEMLQDGQPWSDGIYVNGNLTIKGPGTLEVVASKAQQRSNGIVVEGKLTVSGGAKVTGYGNESTGTGAQDGAIGVQVKNGITITGKGSVLAGYSDYEQQPLSKVTAGVWTTKATVGKECCLYGGAVSRTGEGYGIYVRSGGTLTVNPGGDVYALGDCQALSVVPKYSGNQLVRARFSTTTSKPSSYSTGTPTSTKYTSSKYVEIDSHAFTFNSLSLTYNGKAKKPDVQLSGLTKGTDFTVSFSNNTNVGTAKATITGKGKYFGKMTLSFKIVPKGTTVKKVTAGTKQMKVTVTKPTSMYLKQTTGYQIRYSTSSSMTNAKTVSMTKSSTTKTIKSLKKGKRYYVQVRTYKTVNGTKYYSGWSSKVRSATIK